MATSDRGHVDDEHRRTPTRRFERRAEARDARADNEHVDRFLLLLRNVWSTAQRCGTHRQGHHNGDAPSRYRMITGASGVAPTERPCGDAHQPFLVGPRITVEHEHDAVKVAPQQIRLSARQPRSHERDDGWVASLMDRDCVEEALDHDDRACLRRDRSMQIKGEAELDWPEMAGSNKGD